MQASVCAYSNTYRQGGGFSAAQTQGPPPLKSDKRQVESNQTLEGAPRCGEWQEVFQGKGAKALGTGHQAVYQGENKMLALGARAIAQGETRGQQSPIKLIPWHELD